ncbi:CDP-alcohol phosphatidyltransferase family protein [Zavarzinia sp. CC-PAN008]|uniref:CDP-alcohol phosphatidyltransferase family protein n=1 Tax=Zavarzinia sp. CC-PAN008 TaxID=3243332 RepID=UPI003F748EDA
MDLRWRPWIPAFAGMSGHIEMTLYDLKPRFQALLRPLVAHWAGRGITANMVTLAACAVSVVIGALLCAFPHIPLLFLILPGWLFARMALNAVDGMLAREFGQKSRLGAFLNELTDVVSDAALYLPFAFVVPFDWLWVVVVIFIAVLTEFAGVLGLMVGASRRYDGPVGKSDRALIFGALALWVAIAGTLPAWAWWIMPVLALVLAVTVANRVHQALKEAPAAPPPAG